MHKIYAYKAKNVTLKIFDFGSVLHGADLHLITTSQAFFPKHVKHLKES